MNGDIYSRDEVLKLARLIFPNINRIYSGGTNGTYSLVLGDNEKVYKIFFENPNYDGIKTAKDSFKREVYNTKLLEENGIGTPRILNTYKLAKGVYVIEKEKIDGENLENYLINPDIPKSKKDDALISALDLILKVHEINPKKAKRHKGLEKLVKEMELEPYTNGEQKTIVFDPRLANFVCNKKTGEVYLVDTETITCGNPYQDVGWFLADLSEVAINNPKLLNIEGRLIAEFLLHNPKPLEEAVKEIETFKNNYFKMPRESKLKAYNVSLDDTNFERGIIVIPVSPEDVPGDGTKNNEDMYTVGNVNYSIPKNVAVVNTPKDALRVISN
ncbi:MAG: hypothetical protein J7K73_01385 [Nanoarchaeota archaeon]|nr:hypothetical protein [Nanoarchaeota archaeon]